MSQYHNITDNVPFVPLGGRSRCIVAVAYPSLSMSTRNQRIQAAGTYRTYVRTLCEYLVANIIIIAGIINSIVNCLRSSRQHQASGLRMEI